MPKPGPKQNPNPPPNTKLAWIRPKRPRGWRVLLDVLLNRASDIYVGRVDQAGRVRNRSLDGARGKRCCCCCSRSAGNKDADEGGVGDAWRDIPDHFSRAQESRRRRRRRGQEEKCDFRARGGAVPVPVCDAGSRGWGWGENCDCPGRKRQTGTRMRSELAIPRGRWDWNGERYPAREWCDAGYGCCC
jgi:hypothetical protein